jgi:hypothetical protein
MNHEIVWMPINYVGPSQKLDWVDIGYFEPEPVIKSIISDRDNKVNYLRCPALKDYYANTFAIRCPVDITLSVETDGMGGKYLRSHEFDQVFYDTHVYDRPNENSFFHMASLQFSYLFVSESPIMMEMLPPTFSVSSAVANTRMVPGTFDISKWYRPISFSFEIIDDTKPLAFKRGDVLFYVRFITDKKVNLTRKIVGSESLEIVSAFEAIKFYFPKKSMAQNYDMAKSYVDAVKHKFFGHKKSCPFKNLFNNKK